MILGGYENQFLSVKTRTQQQAKNKEKKTKAKATKKKKTTKNKKRNIFFYGTPDMFILDEKKKINKKNSF